MTPYEVERLERMIRAEFPYASVQVLHTLGSAKWCDGIKFRMSYCGNGSYMRWEKLIESPFQWHALRKQITGVIGPNGVNDTYATA